MTLLLSKMREIIAVTEKDTDSSDETREERERRERGRREEGKEKRKEILNEETEMPSHSLSLFLCLLMFLI